MQIEDLQRQWQCLDEKLERTLKLDGELLRLAIVPPARHRVNRSTFWPALDIAFCLAVMPLAGSFLYDHRMAWPLVVPAVVIMISTILLLNSSIRQLILVSEIDWGGTVVNIQSSLSRLNMAKIRQFKWVILLSPLVGFCGLIVGLQWLLDRLPESHFIFDKINPWWVTGNYALGVLFILFGHAVVGFLAKRFRGRGWWQRMLADLSGSSMKKTREELERWASLDYKVPNAAN